MKQVPVADSIDGAWLNTLELVRQEPGGRAAHVVTTVGRPVLYDLTAINIDPAFRARVETDLTTRNPNWNPIGSVEDTIFPNSMYQWGGPSWSPELAEAERGEVESKAARLFESYREILPLIRGAKANRWGDTYFGRLVDWHGNNQLQYWIEALRTKQQDHVATFNEVNFAVAGEGEIGFGGQLRSSTDHQHMGGPCLVHICLSLLDGHLHLLANYRHWYLQERAYGNLVGLADLLRFLSEQTGYTPGELMVVSGVAQAQPSAKGGFTAIDRLTRDLRAMIGPR